MDLLETILKEAADLPAVPEETAGIYREHKAALIGEVNAILENHRDLESLIGFNPLSIMHNNHKHHAEFMSAVFYVGDYLLLARTVPWVYRVYKAQNFSYNYFTVELNAWISAIEKLNDLRMAPVIEIYKWMISKHENMISLSLEVDQEKPPIHPDWLTIKNHFQVSLLTGDNRTCIKITSDFLDQHTLHDFYTQIIQPSMYEVGYLWEKGVISVAQEHLASSIVTRVMATAVNEIVPVKTDPKGKVLLTASPNEFHEIGVWMVADVMEQAGWEVKFTGADTPQEDLVDMISSFKPDILAISVTIPFNADKAKDVIQFIRNSGTLHDLKILVGGKCFNDNPELWSVIGADGHAITPGDAERKASELICGN